MTFSPKDGEKPLIAEYEQLGMHFKVGMEWTTSAFCCKCVTYVYENFIYTKTLGIKNKKIKTEVTGGS